MNPIRVQQEGQLHQYAQNLVASSQAHNLFFNFMRLLTNGEARQRLINQIKSLAPQQRTQLIQKLMFIMIGALFVKKESLTHLSALQARLAQTQLTEQERALIADYLAFVKGQIEAHQCIFTGDMANELAASPQKLLLRAKEHLAERPFAAQPVVWTGNRCASSGKLRPWRGAGGRLPGPAGGCCRDRLSCR